MCSEYVFTVITMAVLYMCEKRRIFIKSNLEIKKKCDMNI